MFCVKGGQLHLQISVNFEMQLSYAVGQSNEKGFNKNWN